MLIRFALLLAFPLTLTTDPMKRIQSLVSALALLTLGALIVATIVFLIVDAILGGVQ